MCGVYTVGNEGPSVRVEPRSVVVDVGDAVALYCYATGFPPPRLDWSRGGGQLMPRDATVDDGVLRFSVVGMQHGGEYVCTATNVAGSDHQAATVTVTSGQYGHLIPLF